MKKAILTVLAVAAIGVGAAQFAGAHGPGYGGNGGGWGGGPGYGMMGPGYGHGWMMGPGYSDRNTRIDPEKREAFLNETKELRREMAKLRGEFAALVNTDKPDTAKAGELRGKMFELRNKIHEKAEKAGFAAEGGFGPWNCPNW